MESTSSFAPVPAGQYPPFAVVTDTDHTAGIIIATALNLSCFLLFFTIKIFLWRSTSSKLALDEVLLVASTAIALIQSALILGACANGLGRSSELLTDLHRDRVQEIYYTSTLFFIIGLGLSKLSVAFLLLRLTPHKAHRRCLSLIIGSISIWTVGSMLALALQCNLSHPWISIGQNCSGTALRWQIISAFDIASEVGLIAMTTYLVWSLLSSLETKMTVVASFGMRLLLIIPIIFRLKNFNNVSMTTDPSLLLDKFIVWSQTELGYSIIAAITPSLRPFIRTLSTNYGTTTANGYGVNDYENSYGVSVEGSQSGAFELSKVRPKGKGAENNHKIWSGPGWGETTVVAAADGMSVESRDSQQMIIRKDHVWSVASDVR